ncbi:ABC transporter permease [Streptomyces californicus]|uniref:ABC transporter permease n=1 Tax=Streptomyces TaxID=1883 RepID=UPI00099B540D|nr:MULTISPECIES: ABC-2 family transporter protein [unclassified Streptomyces]
MSRDTSTGPVRRLGGVQMFFVLTGGQLRARLRSPLDLAFGTMEGLLYQLATVAVVLLVMPRMHSMAGWEYPELLLLAAFRLAVHAIYMPVFDNVMELPRLMRTQEFDRFLTRPRSAFLQLLTSRFQANFLGDLAVAVAVMALALSQLSVEWTATATVLCVVLLACGVATEASIQVIASTVALRTGGEQAPILTEEVTARFGTYPLDLFDGFARLVLSWIVPIGFVAYFPVRTLLQALTGGPWPLGLGLVLAFTVTLTCVAHWLWRRGLRRYQGAAA